MSNPNYCTKCETYTYSFRVPHKCPPRWLVFVGGDACPSRGKPDESTPSSDASDWSEVYASDESEAAEKRATQSNEDNEYYMMNKTYPVWVRSYPWDVGEKPRRFNVFAEPSVNYYLDEVT